MMIKSPEELVERFNSGLDIARTAVQETYASLRNPGAATTGRNGGGNNNNHLLSARPTATATSSGTGKGAGVNARKGLVMDENWWFWNVLFAASPSVVIALYCEFIVKPEMIFRSEEREKEAGVAAATAKEEEEAQLQTAKVTLKTNDSLNNEIQEDKTSDSSMIKMSPMRRRQEQQKQEQQQQQQKQEQQQQQQTDGAANGNSASSSLSLSSGSNLDELLLSYVRPLFSWFSEPQLPSKPLSEHDNCDNEKYQVVKSIIDDNKSPEKAPKPHREQLEKEQRMQLETQQQELSELQSRLQILKDQIDRQQQEQQQQQDSIATKNTNSNNSGCCDGDDVVSQDTSTAIPKNKASAESGCIKDAKRESLFLSLERTTKAAAASGITMGRNWWVPLLSWWQSRNPSLQSSDNNDSDRDEDDDAIHNRNIKASANVIEKKEKKSNVVPTTPDE